MSDKTVDPVLYDTGYFLSDNEGWREWQSGLDVNIHPKFRRALELAGPLGGKKVLDIGCGRGELVYYSVKNGASSALGIDYSRSAIEIASRTIDRLSPILRPKAKAEVGTILTYPFTDKYDVVFMVEVAEHLYDHELREALARIEAILNPGGRLVIMTPNYLYEKYFSPVKRIVNIPFNFIKWPARIIRGKYRPRSLREFFGKLFKINIDRGELNRKMHVNVTTPAMLKSRLRGFDVRLQCSDHSRNILSIILRPWFGREIEVVATKERRGIDKAWK